MVKRKTNREIKEMIIDLRGSLKKWKGDHPLERDILAEIYILEWTLGLHG